MDCRLLRFDAVLRRDPHPGDGYSNLIHRNGSSSRTLRAVLSGNRGFRSCLKRSSSRSLVSVVENLRPLVVWDVGYSWRRLCFPYCACQVGY